MGKKHQENQEMLPENSKLNQVLPYFRILSCYLQLNRMENSFGFLGFIQKFKNALKVLKLCKNVVVQNF